MPADVFPRDDSVSFDRSVAPYRGIQPGCANGIDKIEPETHTTLLMRRITLAGIHSDTVLGHCDSVSWNSPIPIRKSAVENPDSRLRVAYEASCFPYVRVISMDVDTAAVRTRSRAYRKASLGIFITIVHLLLNWYTTRIPPRYEKHCLKYKIPIFDPKVCWRLHCCSGTDARCEREDSVDSAVKHL